MKILLIDNLLLHNRFPTLHKYTINSEVNMSNEDTNAQPQNIYLLKVKN